MDSNENQNYYEILGVDKLATISDIENAKDRLKFGDSKERAPFNMWEKIDEAYEVLSDSKKRKEYDETLKDDKTINEEDSKKDYLSPQMGIQNQNIYSSSDHEIHSIVSDSKEELEDVFTFLKLKRVGKNVVLSLPTAVLAIITIIKELNKRKKYTLTQETTEKTISKVKTSESELIEEYRKKLDEKIDKLLNEYHTNYDLEIDRLRYTNNIELLKKRIEMKKNEVVQKRHLFVYKLELTALIKQLKAFENSLAKIDEKIQKYEGSQKLTKIHKDLVKVNKQIEEQQKLSNKKNFALKKLEVEKNSLLEKKKLKIQRVKSNREYYAIFKDSFISAYATTKNFM